MLQLRAMGTADVPGVFLQNKSFPSFSSHSPKELSTNEGRCRDLDHGSEQLLLQPCSLHGSLGTAWVGSAHSGKLVLRAEGGEGEQGMPRLKIAAF